MKECCKILILLLLLVSGRSLFAQQLPQYSQYMFNDFAINPAVAGTQNYYQAKVNSRFQWIEIPDAPRTYVLSVYGPHSKRDMGFGGIIFNDIVGPTRRTGFQASYAYNVRVYDGVRLSMGLSAGLLQFAINGSEIEFHDSNDPALGEEVYVNYIPDANFGIYAYAKEFFFGFSTNQMFGNKLRLGNAAIIDETIKDTDVVNRLKNHFFITGGYKYEIDNDFTLEPSIMIKAMSPVPMQLDINARVIYQEMVWLGISYRTKDAVSLLVGYNYENQIYFGYSVDFPTSNIRKYSLGSHEIMISTRFNKIKQSKARPKI